MTPPVQSSLKILSNLRKGFPVPLHLHRTLNEYKAAWHKAGTDAVLKINNVAIQYNIPADVLKLFMRELSNNNRQQLCQGILKGFEKKLSYQDSLGWKANYSIKYPM